MNSDELPDAKLQELAQRLGARAAERLDVERTAQAVLTRLREPPQHTGPAWLKIAATVVLLLGGGGVVSKLLWRPQTPATAGGEPAGAGLSDLSTEQLQQLLQVVDRPADEAPSVSAQDASLDDLTAPQLRELLRSLEG